MPEGELNPAQVKFFERHINKGLLGKLRNKKDLGFAAAFRGYTDADKAAAPLLTHLPMYPNGSAELAEKNALIAEYSRIQTETLAKTSSQKTAIAACEQGRLALAALTTRATALMNKAVMDPSASDPERIVMLKQSAALYLNETRGRYDAKEAPVLAEITEATGNAVTLPMGQAFEQGMKALHGKIAAVDATGDLAAATTALDAIKAEADRLLATQLDALATYAGSPAKAQTIEVGQMDARLRSDLSIATSNAAQMMTWGIPDAKAFAADVEAAQKRGDLLFRETAFADQNAADTAKAARKLLADDLEALNSRAANAIQTKKASFGQLFRDVEARFATVERAFRDIDDVSFAKGQKEPIEDILALTRTAINDLNGYNTDALVAAKKLVDRAAVIVGAAQKATDTNAELKDALKKLDIQVDQGNRKGNPLITKFAAYKTELAELSVRWQTMLLPEAIRAVAAFRTRVEADVQLAKDLETRRANAHADLKAAKSELAQFNLAYGKMLKANGRKPKPYEGSVTSDLASAEGWIDTKTTLSFYDTIDGMILRSRKTLQSLTVGLQNTEGKTDDEIYAEALELQKQLDAAAAQTLLDMEASGVAPDPTVIANARASVDAQIALLATRSDLLAQDNATERQKAEDATRKETYLTEAKAYVKKIKEEVKAAPENSALDHYKDDVKGHLTRIEESIKLVEKGGMVRAAQSELTFLQKTIEGIKARGPRTDKNKLDQIGTEWANAVKGFEGKCTEMQAAVEKYLADNDLGTDYAAALTALGKALGDIQTRLDPAAFIRVANRFRDPTQFKAAREEALQRVRYFNDLLLKDPVIQQCVRNPFGIRDFATPLASRLRQIELNVLRAA
ncbi:hypothetical protein EGN72_13460 [Pseudorhodobacter sp. E13]|uniref:hypothetical protein n=1 Tax=Pseudorhodobacter sp. E13 TaxID=2487931 RepID=UPI000F8D05FC|nr:hypothetical protein [Pseudorhodobacter sp. E13]RUS59700.1 hypothetical protein EGN72_13460 [Pseudorhodobacter sp. E13]